MDRKKSRQAVNDRRGAASGHPYAKRIDSSVHHVTRAVYIRLRLYVPDGICLGAPVILIGLGITLFMMLLRSVIDDHGYHIHKEDLMDDDDKGVKA